MSNQYDAVVVGAGHNSLSTAAYLAKSGMSVCVLEKNEIIGGGAVSREVTAPGFKHDTHATGIILAMANPMISQDELELQSRFGLKFMSPEATYVSLFEDETWIGTFMGLDQTCESIAKYSAKDAETYRAFVNRTIKMGPIFTQGMFKPPIPPEMMLTMLGQGPEGQEIISLYGRSCYDLVLEMFEHPKVRMHFLKWVAEGMVNPSRPGTASSLYFMTAVAHTQEETAVVGGTQAMSDSLGRCIEHHGGEIRINTWVRKVITSGGKATGVELSDGEVITASKCVVASIHPHLLGDYIDGLDPTLVEDAKNVPLSSYGAINTHWALHEAPSYKCPEINKALLVETIPADMDRLMSSFDDCTNGKLASVFNAVVAHHTNHDPSRAPEGKHTLYLYCFAPLLLKNTGPLGGQDVDGWTDEIRDEYKEWMVSEYAKFCTNMTPDNIIASAAESPKDMAEWSPSFQNGDIMGVTGALPLGARPTPVLAQYAVPGAQGLYLSGPFCHPGGAITGGGRATAMKILMDSGVDVSTLMQI
ncbi:MAG: NAD(P)/FAD-dependent oxidoreductase [Halieaceae bacterium]|jgi:phytoene dehydrogenase-like protein|nr:NAD(P)/FAD-dependent oxidoreductase [Halieaceae bacterium]